MVIKNLSWKRFAPGRLMDYIDNSEKTLGEPIYFNILKHDRKKAMQSFILQNHHLKARSNSNKWLHEIISFSPEDKEQLSEEKIRILVNKYLELRASKNVAYGSIHCDKGHYHVHLMVSPNEYRSRKVSHFDKGQYMKIRYDLEHFQIEQFPELEHSVVFLNEREKNKNKAPKRNEQEVIKRSGTSKKEQLKSEVKFLFQLSNSIDEFMDKILQETDWEVYYRNGNYEGIKVGKQKYRFTTLGISKEQMQELDKKELKEIEKRRNELLEAMNDTNLEQVTER